MPNDRDITGNYHRGNPESKKAKELSKLNADIDRKRILALAKARGVYGLTCDEAERLLGLPHQTCSARISELKKDGDLVPMEIQRRTRHNAWARVLTTKPQKDLFT